MATDTTTTTTIPGLVPGTWTIDPDQARGEHPNRKPR